MGNHGQMLPSAVALDRSEFVRDHVIKRPGEQASDMICEEREVREGLQGLLL